MRRPDGAPGGWRVRAVRFVALVLAALLSVGAVAVVLQQGSAPGPVRPPDRGALGASTAASVDRCDDTFLLTVDGGGEQALGSERPGRTVDVVRRAVLRHASVSGRTVRALGLGLHSEPPAALLGTRTRVDKARRTITAARVRAWRGPVGAAVTRAVAALDQAALDCPAQQVLLSGYAQGASVVHRVLGVLRGRSDGLARVGGALLVSDPDRRARSVVSPVGAPAAGAGRSGVFPRFLEAVADVPPVAPTLTVVSVCSAGDLVCDPVDNSVKDALRLARSYHLGAGARLVRAGALGLWRSARLRPVPDPGVQVVSGEVGEPLTLQLAVDVLPEAAAGVAWAEPLQLPPGFTLSPDGVLTGTPTEQGSWNITYVVRGTDPPTTDVPGAVVLTVASEAVAVSAGGQTSCETRTDATAWCWGRNNFGQLGNATTAGTEVPVEVAGSGGWATVSTGGSTTCGIKSDRTLWCWGLNNAGQLGVGRGAPRSTPVQVGTGSVWTSVSTSWFHTCATRSNGTLWCWGSNLRGQLGDGTFDQRATPTRVGTDSDWASVTTGGFSTCGVRADATAWCWGQNVFGQGTGENQSPQPRPSRVAGDQAWAQLSSGWAHTCGVTLEGAAWCWGLNDRGQLGDGTKTLRRVAVPVKGDRIWTSLSVGDATSCGVDNTGSAWCWGSNSYSQLGDGGRQSRTVPVLVRSDESWLSVDAGWFHTCGSHDGGVTACWGNNELGQVGDGSRTDRPVPKEVR
ncbi:hypothetical protein NPS01_24110 [Nocardioides psychrotolerans]|uniref:cutinase family protein n=1 Tax=Nocardioides psychrotolerans TaxID=1005945 RepID=UPI000B82D067|nr:cutinase family protein [Nocardioides psychrotolerans]GEP38748.1 hypothetical protein NPS01_24110 [Nocardioides psychrotolerans]